jgi:hypothetical protein
MLFYLAVFYSMYARHIQELEPKGKEFLLQAWSYVQYDKLQSIYKFLERDNVRMPATWGAMTRCEGSSRFLARHIGYYRSSRRAQGDSRYPSNYDFSSNQGRLSYWAMMQLAVNSLIMTANTSSIL